MGVGIIGLGVGAEHARAFADHPACRVAALCDRNPLRLDEIAARYPAANRHLRAEDLIDDPEVSIVSVASNDDDHHRQVVRALRAGKHVFAEKPLCLRPRELDEIRDAWRASKGLRLSTNTVLRRSPRFQWVKDAVAQGELGTLYLLEADYVYGRLHKLTEGWRGRIPGYSVTLGGGIHMVDLVLWIAGQRPVEAVACSSDLASRGTAYKGNDLTLALLRFDSGLLAKVGANFASVHPHYHRFLAYGTLGTFENGLDAGRLWRSRASDAAPEPVDRPYPGVAKGALIPAFVDAVLGRGEPVVTEDEVFDAMAVCQAIDRAACERRAVAVEYE
jgi:predicted dehydrogenase